MIADKEGNNSIHYAVICNTCLKPLLEAIKTNDIACDLNTYNHGKFMCYILGTLLSINIEPVLTVPTYMFRNTEHGSSLTRG